MDTSCGIKTERMLVLKRVVVLLCDLRPTEPECFISEVMHKMERNFLKKELSLRRIPRSPQVRTKLRQMIDRDVHFTNFAPAQREATIDLTVPLTYTTGSYILYPDLKHNLYFIEKGELQLMHEHNTLRHLSEGDTFGTLNNTPSLMLGTVAFITKFAKVWYITQSHWDHLAADHTAWKRIKYTEALASTFRMKQQDEQNSLAPSAPPMDALSLASKHAIPDLNTNCIEANERHEHEPKGCANDKATPMKKLKTKYDCGLPSDILYPMPENLYSSPRQLPVPSLLRAVDTVNYPNGTIVMHQGQASRNFYYILDGMAAVFIRDDEEALREISRLGPRKHFGENGFLKNRTSPTTVKALKDLKCLRIQTYLFEQSLNEWFD